jgi:hypothetical protein
MGLSSPMTYSYFMLFHSHKLHFIARLGRAGECLCYPSRRARRFEAGGAAPVDPLVVNWGWGPTNKKTQQKCANPTAER